MITAAVHYPAAGFCGTRDTVTGTGATVHWAAGFCGAGHFQRSRVNGNLNGRSVQTPNDESKMTPLFTLVLFCCTSLVFGKLTHCENGWILNPVNSKCYFFNRAKTFGAQGNRAARWSEARADCSRRGGDLAKIRNGQENAFVHDLIKNNGDAWFGGTRDPLVQYMKSSGEWEWSRDLQRLSSGFRNWAPFEPNNHGGHQKCLQMYQTTGQWDDDNCWYGKNFVCEKEGRNEEQETKLCTVTKFAKCPCGWEFDGRQCVFVETNDSMNFFQANQYCALKGAYLATIFSSTGDSIAKFTQGKVSTWIGLYRLDAKLGFTKWMDGKDVDFTNWHGAGGTPQFDNAAIRLNAGSWDLTGNFDEHYPACTRAATPIDPEDVQVFIGEWRPIVSCDVYNGNSCYSSYMQGVKTSREDTVTHERMEEIKKFVSHEVSIKTHVGYSKFGWTASLDTSYDFKHQTTTTSTNLFRKQATSSVSEWQERSVSQTCAGEGSNLHATLYQWVLFSDVTGEEIWTPGFECVSGLEKTPMCPFGSCADPDCQHCKKGTFENPLIDALATASASTKPPTKPPTKRPKGPKGPKGRRRRRKGLR